MFFFSALIENVSTTDYKDVPFFRRRNIVNLFINLINFNFKIVT